MFPLFRNPDHAPDLHGPGVIQPDPEAEHPVNLVAFFGCEGVEVLGDGLGVALDEASVSPWTTSTICRLALRRSTSSRAPLSSVLKDAIFSP